MESKLNHERLHRCAAAVLEASARKRRRFLEFVDLQVAFTDYHLLREQCIEGAVVVKHIPKPDMLVCVLGDRAHCEEARALDFPFKPSECLRDLERCFFCGYGCIRTLTHDFDAFVASRTVLRMLKHTPVGDALEAAGKWPMQLSHHAPLVEQVDRAKATVRFCFGGESRRGLVVGNVRMTPEQLEENVDDVVRGLVGALPENWDNIRSMHIKSTMGPPQRIY